ncbi:hypothetical protein NK553_24215 [Pseudomonas sp. ZM23]|uniref:Uncharacterized protein n=1 Tax=Pseudomonas triclosanedens TaxID=2961893 RepID=A0ABY6ZS67_9PSED|nr:hypothetical protein [Pseudomonas triclosanedens]MCP8467062.1 hypothetical protein [Pseudomonas triclosanedens]MCP8472789.1 hypothetical protein [Pseudomonas triclosanedens]MCP8478220.1 hypothetical protein [Pseudomonas triclosanedens]WAI47626.1 hypothetical protein OU419_17790 [Pseudomonas triclosanedens]
MFDTIRAFFLAYWYVVVPVVTLCFLAIPVIVYWSEVRYWLMNVRMRLPLVGRIRGWVRHPGDRDKSGFLSSEKELCSFYANYYQKHKVDKSFFKKCENYLAKANEDGRREKSLGIWVLIIALMLIEATAFGYALAPFALTLATPKTAMVGAFAIGLVISIIGLLLSEFSGRELYKNSVVGHIMSFEDLRGGGDMGDMVRKNIITIDNTNDDDARPEFQQMLNRVRAPKDGAMPAKRYRLVSGYTVFIVVLACAAFWVRTETLNAQEAELIANPPAVSQSADDFPSGSDDDFPLTGDMAELSQQSAGKSAQDQIDALHRASLVTFAVLSVLFVFIQATSTFLSYIFCFAGTHSRKAWELTHGFANADEFQRYHDNKARSIAVDAQAALGALQAMQMRTFRVSADDKEKTSQNLLQRTFENYLKVEDISATESMASQMAQKFLKAAIGKVQAQIDDGDLSGAARTFNEFAPGVSNISDDNPEMGSLKQSFEAFRLVFQPAAAPAPVVAPVAAPAPVVEVAPVPLAEAAPAVAAAPVAPVAEVAAAAPAFDKNAWGDLTDLEDEDLPFVAAKFGVEVAVLRRARKLQEMEKA